MKITANLSAAYEFACHSAACRPPTSGGTGGSNSSGGNTSSGDGPTIKGGVVHHNGQAISGPIRGRPGSWTATVKGVPKVQVLDRANPGKFKMVAPTVTGHTKDELAKRISQEYKDSKASDRLRADKSSASRSVQRSGFGTGERGERVAKLANSGRVKATDVKVSRDGTVKVKGVDVGLGIVKVDGGKYRVDGRDGYVYKSRVVSTQAGAKSQIARLINDLTSD